MTYIAKDLCDSTKTYDKYVDVVVYTEKGDPRYMEKLPAKHSDMMDVVYRMNPSNGTVGKVVSVTVKSTLYKLKCKWTV